MRPRTTVTLLEPSTSTSTDTNETLPDWSEPPTEHPNVPAAVDPLSSTEAVLIAGTVISRWMLYLPEGTTVDSFWRVVWNGDTYDIDGDVTLNEGSREGYVSCILKRVEG